MWESVKFIWGERDAVLVNNKIIEREIEKERMWLRVSKENGGNNKG